MIVNVIAMLLGIAAVLILCKVQIPAFTLALNPLRFEPATWNFGGFLPATWPAIAWPYFVFIGSTVTFAVAVCFPTRKPLPVSHIPVA